MSVVVQVEMGKLLLGFEKNIPLTGMKTCKHNIHHSMHTLKFISVRVNLALLE